MNHLTELTTTGNNQSSCPLQIELEQEYIKEQYILCCCMGRIHPKEILRFLAVFDYTISQQSIILACFIIFSGFNFITLYGIIVIFASLILTLSAISATGQIYDQGVSQEELKFYFSYRNFYSIFLSGLILELMVSYSANLTQLMLNNEIELTQRKREKAQILIWTFSFGIYIFYVLGTTYSSYLGNQYVKQIAKKEKNTARNNLLSCSITRDNIASPENLNFDSKSNKRPKITVSPPKTTN